MATTNFDTVTATTFLGAVTGAITGNVTGNLNGQITYPIATVTATATTGTAIADAGMLQLVTVTSDHADKIVILPTPTPGTIVILKNGATGYELRSSAPATVAINGGAGANAESAIAANSMVIAVCTSATTWQAIGIAAATLAGVDAAA